MQFLWWKFPFNCPNCDKEVSILQIHFSALGNVLIEGRCNPCGKELEMKVDCDKAVDHCRMLDFFLPYENQMKDMGDKEEKDGEED